MTRRMLLFAALTLVAAPVLAGCAQNGGTGTTTPTGAATPTGTASPTPTATPTSVVPTTPAAAPLVPPVTLKIGLMNPLTNDLANLGPSMQRGMELAVDDVNAAAAVTGLTVQIVGKEDDTTGDQTRAVAAYEKLVGLGATAIAGPCCSGVTGAILTKAVEDEVIVSSPSATSPTLTETDRKGFFWRVSPTDAGQGRVLAQLVAADAVKKANLVIVNNDYGNGFATVFQAEFTAKGGTIGTTSKTGETDTVVSSQVTEACAGSPEAIVLVVYTKQGAEILKAMQAQGCLAKVKVYASEGIYSPKLAESVVEQAGKDAAGKWLAEGMKGTTPQALNTSAFTDKYRAKYNEAPQQYTPESYDAVMYVVLGALSAKSADGTDIATKILGTANPGGTKCREFRTCALLVLAGQDIDYQGYAHDLEYSAKHEPKSGSYSHWKVNAQGEMAIIKENVVPG